MRKSIYIKVLIAEDEPLSLQNLSGQMRDLLGADALIEELRTDGRRLNAPGKFSRSWC